MTTSAQAARTYVRQNVMTSSPEKLVGLLLDRGLSWMDKARQAIEDGDVPATGEALSKAFSIVSELRTSIDLEKGGEVAQNLERLYDFVQQRLMSANRERHAALVEEAMDIFSTVKEGWDGILGAS